MLTNFAPFIFLRRLWRKLGLNELLDFCSQQKIQKELARYRTNPQPLQKLALFNEEIQLRITSESELRRIIMTRLDAPFIKKFLDRIHPGDVVWDIGASIGTYSLLISKKTGTAGKVFAFEPEPNSFERLKENASLNPGIQIECVPIGLGSENKKIPFTITTDFGSGCHSFLSISDNPVSELPVLLIRKGDSLIAEKEFPSPQALKIDVEGFEDEVISGLAKTIKNPDCRTILCEIHFRLLDECGKTKAVETILQTLKTSGFAKIIWLDFQHLMAIK